MRFPPIDPYARQFANIPNSGMDGARPGFYWHSDRVIVDQRRRQIADQWRWEVIAGNIYLYPVPTTAVTIRYLYYNATGSVTDLDTRHELPLLYLAAAHCCRVLANRFRGQGTTFTEEGIGQADSSGQWDTRFDHYMEEFKREMAEILY